MMRLLETYRYFSTKKLDYIERVWIGRTLDDLWKRMSLLLWERREGLYMSLQQHEELVSGWRPKAETRRDGRWTDLWPLDL